MHVEFIARGTGSAEAAADYLLGDRKARQHGLEARPDTEARGAVVAGAVVDAGGRR